MHEIHFIAVEPGSPQSVEATEPAHPHQRLPCPDIMTTTGKLMGLIVTRKLTQNLNRRNVLLLNQGEYKEENCLEKKQADLHTMST